MFSNNCTKEVGEGGSGCGLRVLGLSGITFFYTHENLNKSKYVFFVNRQDGLCYCCKGVNDYRTNYVRPPGAWRSGVKVRRNLHAIDVRMPDAKTLLDADIHLVYIVKIIWSKLLLCFQHNLGENMYQHV